MKLSTNNFCFLRGAHRRSSDLWLSSELVDQAPLGPGRATQCKEKGLIVFDATASWGSIAPHSVV